MWGVDGFILKSNINYLVFVKYNIKWLRVCYGYYVIGFFNFKCDMIVIVIVNFYLVVFIEVYYYSVVFWV